jgi:hypothetical protein
MTAFSVPAMASMGCLPEALPTQELEAQPAMTFRSTAAILRMRRSEGEEPVPGPRPVAAASAQARRLARCAVWGPAPPHRRAASEPDPVPGQP